ncbi:cytidylate kinase-like family protein [Algivirga pacifica]|uniref:Cytidylate kinase-like family protein n=1 Tax=Algivirga pacifica TaxID=1162670 RepID=A0ABP9DJ55_9BACT
MQAQLNDYLSWYMGQVPLSALEQDEKLPPLHCHRRAITISRSYGSEALPIARALAERLNQKYQLEGKYAWIVLDREILHQVAGKLDVSSWKLNESNTPLDRGVLESIQKAFDPDQNVMDANMVQALHTVLGSYLYRGNVIIVGRAAATFTETLPEVLNVKLRGSLAYRTSRISIKKHLDKDEAEKVVKKMDKRRKNFIHYVYQQPDEPLYDIAFNRERVPTDVILDTVMRAVEVLPEGNLNG